MTAHPELFTDAIAADYEAKTHAHTPTAKHEWRGNWPYVRLCKITNRFRGKTFTIYRRVFSNRRGDDATVAEWEGAA